MESPNANIDNSLAMSAASEKITNDQNAPNASHPSEENPNPNPNDVVPTSLLGPPALVGGPNNEYSCRFCNKKFSSKQAVGGHQNAHRYERTMEKAVKELRENPAHYYSNLSAQPRPRPPLIPGPYAMPMMIGRPMVPMSGLTYSPTPIQGFNHVYPGWTGPAPGINYPQFIGPPMHMQYARPVAWNPQAVIASRITPSVNFGVQIGIPVNVHPQEQEVVDEIPDPDTTLRL